MPLKKNKKIELVSESESETEIESRSEFGHFKDIYAVAYTFIEFNNNDDIEVLASDKLKLDTIPEFKYKLSDFTNLNAKKCIICHIIPNKYKLSVCVKCFFRIFIFKGTAKKNYMMICVF